MSRLLLTFYGDDFTGSTDALEQLSLAGIRAVLFIEPPTPRQLRGFPGLQAVGVAGLTRSLRPDEMAKVLRPALRKLKALGAPHVHYKVCSTFDSSPATGSIGRAIDVAAEIFRTSFVPVLAAAPGLGRYTVFGQHFARYGIGSTGAIHRLDRHPSIGRHPVTPMTEADLRLHLTKQTKKKIALFDILKVALPDYEARAALEQLLADKPEVILFDTLEAEHLQRVGKLINEHASARQPLFSVGSSGIETALAAAFKSKRRQPVQPPIRVGRRVSPSSQILIGSGSCSPVTGAQIAWALKRGFAEVPLDVRALASPKKSFAEIRRAVAVAVSRLASGRSVIVHTTRRGSDQRVAALFKNQTVKILGTALGKVLGGTLAQSEVRRLCIAGGDTSSFAARALGITALEIVAPLTPGAPLCRATAPGAPVDGREIVFKGGQVGAENYFETVLKGK